MFMYIGLSLSSLLIAKCKNKRMSTNGWLERRARKEWKEASNVGFLYSKPGFKT